MRFGMMMENRHMKKIRKVIKFLSKKLNILQEKVNMLYVAISILVVVAIGALIGSCWMPESYNDVKNIVVGLSTGIITSALVTVYIENINARMDKKRKVRYKQMLLNPLYMSIDRLYKRLILNIELEKNMWDIIFCRLRKQKKYLNFLIHYEILILRK